jgi:hypothetical protein
LIPTFDNSSFFPGVNDTPPPDEIPIDSDNEDDEVFSSGRELYFQKKEGLFVWNKKQINNYFKESLVLEPLNMALTKELIQTK